MDISSRHPDILQDGNVPSRSRCRDRLVRLAESQGLELRSQFRAARSFRVQRIDVARVRLAIFRILLLFGERASRIADTVAAWPRPFSWNIGDARVDVRSPHDMLGSPDVAGMFRPEKSDSRTKTPTAIPSHFIRPLELEILQDAGAAAGCLTAFRR